MGTVMMGFNDMESGSSGSSGLPPAQPKARWHDTYRDWRKLLSRRGGMNLARLAAQLHLMEISKSKPVAKGMAHLSQVLSGARRGEKTWPKLAEVLTKAEYEMIKSYADARFAERQAAKNRSK